MKRAILVSALVFFIGCTNRPHPVHVGIGGAIVGAGAGAAVGSMIANGDVTGSAWLGAGIGFPVALAAGYLYQQYQIQQSEEELEYVRQRQVELYQRERLLELAWRRQEALEDIEFDESREKTLFLGPSLGVPYR